MQYWQFKKHSSNINAKKCLIIVCGVWNIRQKWLSVSWPFIVSREIWKAWNQIYFVSFKIAQKVLFCCWICTVGDRAVIKVLSKVRYWANWDQGGITCGAIDEPRKSSKAIDEHVIINFRDKNVVIARIATKNEVFILIILIQLFCSIDSFSALSIAILFHR